MVDKGNEAKFLEKREGRQVLIQFIDDKLQHFNALAEKDEFSKDGLLLYKKGDIKHYGVVIGKDPHAKDFCTCESFWFSNSDDYKKTHATAFQCKHILGARKMRFEGHP